MSSQDAQGTRKTVVIVRHAKAEQEAATDHARPLTERGLADAQAAGSWLGEQLGRNLEGQVEALVSTATRARLTWEQLAGEVPARLRLLDGLYEAGPGEVVQTLTMLDDAVRVAVVVGHNPTMQAVVDALGDGAGPADDELRRRGFPTCALAVLEHDGAWQDLADASCSVTAFHVARG
jgi:phosphohistidine phosphatase